VSDSSPDRPRTGGNLVPDLLIPVLPLHRFVELDQLNYNGIQVRWVLGESSTLVPCPTFRVAPNREVLRSLLRLLHVIFVP